MTQNARQLPLSSIDSGGVMNQTYYYDPNGSVSHVDDAFDWTRDRWMDYDASDRLIAAGAGMFGGDFWHRFSYDAIDNLRSWKLPGVKDNASYVYTNNRLTSVLNSSGNAVHSFAYDPQGNLDNKNGVPHVFDYGNRLREVPGTEYYRYDGLGRRALAWRPVGGSTLSMYSQGGQVMYQEAGPHTRASEHIYLAGSLVASRERNWVTNVISTKYQHTDALGSPIAVSNEAGSVIERTNYDPYGGPIGKVVDGIGYTGHVMDPATGLTNMQQRYYDQGVGRFLSVDPVSASAINGGNFNRYWYANNNPYKFTDPDGRLAFLIPVAIVAWRAYSPYDTVSSAAGNISTLSDDNASAGDKVAAGAELAGSLLGGKAGRSAAGGIARVVGKGKGQISEAADAAGGGAAASKKAANANIGDRVETPDTNPENFVRLRGGQGQRNNSTGETWQVSRDNHSGDPVGEFKVGVDGKPPQPTRKITVTRSDCKVSKRDGC